jgi:H+-translocating NAD(P) transhydrogenase subunit beta
MEMMQQYILEICYLIASVLFVVGLKMLSGPKTARKGNILAAVGMVLAILATIALHKQDGNAIGNYGWIFSGLLIGTVVGWLAAKKVKMTAMPQMVSLFNGMGGACAALISLIEFGHYIHTPDASMGSGTMLVIVAGLIIGTVSFTGSIIAYAKLQGLMNKNIRIPLYNIWNNLLMIAILVLSFVLMRGDVGDASTLFYTIFGLSLVYGVLFVVPIGGADMPVVISLLNSFTGVAAAFGGFLYDNQVMLTGGILVGSAGTLLTFVMCNAMNRSLSNVIFGSFGGGSTAAAGGSSKAGGAVKEISASDTAVLLNYSKKVIVVPGYGLAVAQAQHAIHELESILEERGVEVKYAIHPVAGRMPGHMNVLLAESNVDYGKLCEMEEVNPEFPTTDVVIVVGANDVVNPAAKHDPSSPIFGMPVLDVENAKNVIVIKRSMNAGYAGIDNELFGYPNCSMLFDDAKSTITKLVAEVKQL